MTRRTTICCSAVALLALARGPSEPIALTPTRLVWTLALNNQISVAPAYDRDRVFFSIDGDRLVAYELLSGRQLWIVESSPAFQPAAGDDLVFVPTVGALVALRASDGSRAWSMPLADPLAVRPVWDNGWLLLVTRTGVAHALRATDGHSIWQRDLGTPPHAAPALAADRVYVPTSDNRLLALDVRTGAPVWERRVGGQPGEILAQDDRLYFGSTDNFLYCLLARDGVIDWRWRTGGDIIGAPVADERRVYFLSLDNVLRALDRRSGGQQWMRGLTMRPTAGPAIAGATLVVAGLYPIVRTFAIKDGAPAPDLAVPGDAIAPPHVLEQPVTRLPMVMVVARDIVKGATATLSIRSMDPAETPIAPLPNPIILPQTPPTRPPGGSAAPPDAVPYDPRTT